MKNIHRSNPKKKKAKMNSSPRFVAPEGTDAYRDEVCAALAEKMNAGGVRAHRTGPEVRQMIRQIEASFVRAHVFSISNVGIDLAIQDATRFREAVTQICPPYFTLFRVVIHHVDDLAEETDLDSTEMMQIIQDVTESVAARSEEVGRVEWDDAIQEWKQQQRVEFRSKCQEYYQRWKAQGHTDANVFEQFPEWVVAVVPERN